MLTVGPRALDPNPEMTLDVVVTDKVPLATYRLATNGVVTPALAYVVVTGAVNAPPAVPVAMLSDVGYMSPLNRFTLYDNVNPAELFKCGMVLE